MAGFRHGNTRYRNPVFYQGILGISSTWKAVKVEKDGKAKEIHISLEYGGEQYRRPVCGAPAKRHDCRIRELRHLDTREYKTILEVRVPRVRCAEHKVQQMPLEFAEKHSLYTGMFEMLVILRFHVSQHFNKALDKVRAGEHRETADEKGKSPLSKSRFMISILFHLGGLDMAIAPA